MSDAEGSSSTDQLLPPSHRVQSKRRSSSKTRRKRAPFGAQSAIAEDGGMDSYDDDDAGSDTDRNWDASLAGSPEATASTEMPELPPILASLSEPLVLSSTVSVSVLPVEPFRRANPRATDTHRRPNPWEHANRKTFKPIITIGGQLPLGQLAVRRPPRANFALPFIQQRKLERQGSRPERIAPSSLYAVNDTTLDAHRCGTLCVGAAIDVREVYTYYMSLGVQCTAYKDGLNVVVHCLHVNDDEDSDSHAFYFMYGSMVLWNFDARGENRLIAESRKLFSRGTLEDPEVDDFGFVYVSAADAKPHIHKDVIHLTTSDVMEKLAVSFGLAQSAKLSVFERTTESTIADTRHIPEQLANSGKISLSRSEISKRVGQLFVDRSQVNLHSDMLDTPAFFWDEAEWEPLYQRTAKYMEIEKRVSVLNHRLDIIADLFDMLASEMHEKHASNLEIIVIVLIVIEVIFQVLGLMQGWVKD